jgi:hypothetical protein
MHLKVLSCLSMGMGMLLLVAGVPASALDPIDPELERLVAAGQSPTAALAEAARQEAEGDALGAASTLERALIENPAADAVRIEYVALLCKLGDRGTARLELDLLQGRTVGGQAWNRMVSACGKDFADTRRTGKVSARLSAGLAYDENAADQLSPFAVFGPGSRDGLAVVASADVDARIAAGSGHFYGSAMALTHSDVAGPRNDYQFGEMTLGYGNEFEGTATSFGAVVRSGRLIGDHFVTAYGGQVSIATRAGQSTQIIVQAEAVHEDYADDTFNGMHYALMVGFDVTTSSRQRFSVGLGAEQKNTQLDQFDYNGYRLAAAFELPLDQRGTTLNGSLTLRRMEFEKLPLFNTRKEWRLYSRLAVGIPLIGRNLSLEPAVTYRLRDYNAASFLDDYNSIGGELRLVWTL